LRGYRHGGRCIGGGWGSEYLSALSLLAGHLISEISRLRSNSNNRDTICRNENQDDNLCVRTQESINWFRIGQNISPSRLESDILQFPCESESKFTFHRRKSRIWLNFQQ
jgi:hypothetical protein